MKKILVRTTPYPDKRNSTKDMQIGDMAWVDQTHLPPCESTGITVLMRTYIGFIDLQNPNRTWPQLDVPMRIMPPGAVVTLTVRKE